MISLRTVTLCMSCSARPGLPPPKSSQIAQGADHAVEAHGHAIIAQIRRPCWQERMFGRAGVRECNPAAMHHFGKPLDLIGLGAPEHRRVRPILKLLNTKGISRQWQDSNPAGDCQSN